MNFPSNLTREVDDTFAADSKMKNPIQHVKWKKYF